METASVFDRYAFDYERSFNENPVARYQRNHVQSEVAPYFKKAQRVLDVGCGPGSDFEFYNQFNLKLDAIDISSAMVVHAEAKAESLKLNAQISRSDLLNWRSPYCYDIIVLNFGVINAVTDIKAAFDKLNELLKENGLLVVVAMPPFHLWYVMEQLLRLQFRTCYRRIVSRRVQVADRWFVKYYTSSDFAKTWQVVRRVHLGLLLPMPEQFQRSKGAQWWFKRFKAIDARLASRMPEWLGGDHVLYLLNKAAHAV